MEKDRKWTFILYPDSAPENWLDILQETGLEIAISPLHDKDIIEASGELKKAHYHILLCFPGPTTYQKVNKICESLNATIPKRILSVIGIYRYFTHKDNPEKFQYNEEDIRCLNGFDIKDLTGMTTSQQLVIKKQIQKIIRDRNILEYCDLLDYLLEESVNDFYYIASTNTFFFDRYICSRRHKKTLQQENIML